MFKLLLIMALVLYIVYKIGGFFFKAGAASQQYRQQGRKPQETVNKNSDRTKRNGHIKGGEYVDYEEVK
jgi:hypothetical protein